MTADEIQALAASIAQQQMTHAAAPEADGRPRERGRAMAQGLTFGGADEAEAWLRSTFGGEDYDAALEDVRGKLKGYRDARPVEALGFEAGGATLPAILGAVASGGTTTAAALPMLARFGRLIGAGMMEGGTYAFNAGEGGGKERLMDVPEGMVYGTAGSVAGAGVAKAAWTTMRGLTDYAARKFGPRASKAVEREIQKAADDAGISLQEAVDGVVNGRLLADNKTIASVARGWRAQSAEAETVLRDVYETRPQQLRAETTDFLRRNMAGEGDPNVLRAQQANTAAAKAAQGAEYNKAFDAMPEVSEDVQGTLADALQRVPEGGKAAETIYRAQTGEAPFFSLQDGVANFSRPPSLRDAEIIRRGLYNAKNKAFAAGDGEIGAAISPVEKGVRSALDEASPDLAATRAKWSQIESAGEAFDMGRKALSKSADEVEIEFEAARQKGEEAVAAYRAGLFAAYKNRASTGSGKSLPRNIASDERKEGQILRIVFPEDELDTALGKAKLASDAQDSANTILGGSDTAITQGRIAEQAPGLIADGMGVAHGDIGAGARLVATLFKGFNSKLSPKEAAEAARLVVETNPNIVARALTDKGALNSLRKIVQDASTKSPPVVRNTGGAIGGLLSTY